MGENNEANEATDKQLISKIYKQLKSGLIVGYGGRRGLVQGTWSKWEAKSLNFGRSSKTFRTGLLKSDSHPW